MSAFAAIRTALATSGAEIVSVDLATPVPQRPERLKQLSAAPHFGESPLSNGIPVENAAAIDAQAASLKAVTDALDALAADTPKKVSAPSH